MSEEEIFEKLNQALTEGDDLLAADLAKQALKMGISAIDILNKGCTPGMMKAGEMYASGLGGASLTDLLMAGEAMQAVLTVIRPHLKAEKSEMAGKLIIGMVEGDLHTIGKSVVISMFESAGWDVIDLGEDVPLNKFIETAKQQNPDIIGAASAITGCLDKLKTLKEIIDKEKIPVKYMVGGWATGPEFAKSIGAYFARDALAAVQLATELMEEA
ncbi:MAG: cobalamin B12-binding domain-containing protein [Candidatus Jordarchaeum sp.]|uniref:cobalamin B12-binding domain-containing protein n=1 Tax=Candidatus Jordarchaeum sp. TaxID=2823881 RepID=UPI0040497CC5